MREELKRWLPRIDRALNEFDRPGIILLFLVPVFLQWIVPMVRSRFWLDETVTWWVTNGGLRELIVSRCLVMPSSILYSSFVLLLRSFGAHREWLLRLPSLVSVLFAAAILFDLARRWFSKRVAIAATVFFCVQPWVSFAAADARPYGPGLLAVVAATWLMLRWTDSQRMVDACRYGVVAALIPHFHLLFTTVLIFHGMFLIAVLPRNRQAFRQATMVFCIAVVLLLPLLPQYIYLFEARAAHTFSNPRTLWDLGRQFLPTLPLVFSVLVAAAFPRWLAAERNTPARKSILLAILWAAVPMSLLYTVAKLSGSDLFVGRYLLPYVPGIALCFGIVLEYLSPRLRTGIVLIVFLIPTAVSCVRGSFPSHTTWGDWGAAIRFVDHENQKGTPLVAMMRSPFPESDAFEWREVRMDDDALFAPLSYYVSSADWRPLPATFTSTARLAIDDALHRQRALFFVSQGEDQATAPYFEYFREKGTLTKLADFEGVFVYRLLLTSGR